MARFKWTRFLKPGRDFKKTRDFEKLCINELLFQVEGTGNVIVSVYLSFSALFGDYSYPFVIYPGHTTY